MGTMQGKQNNHQQRKSSISAEPQNNAEKDGVDAVLSNEAIRNLTGFFDVLIQMDFAHKQRNEQGSIENERRAKDKDS
jgi:hypothetical protein